MSPFETAYFELYISDGLHNMKNMRTSNFFLGLTIFLLAACSSSIDEDLDIKKMLMIRFLKKHFLCFLLMSDT